jgi:hypothetical protein
MGLLIFLQVLMDLGFIAIATLLLIERSKAKTVEDPRMARGLQLLSSKIAILQDLMDRSETMGRQLTQILENKEQEIQERMEQVELHLHKIQRATEKSQEVAQIFQDRIPHQEIIERQTTVKYLQAAKMAHQGFSVDDISKQVDIPRGELELIVKLNRDRIIVEEPAWAQPAEKTPSHPAEFVVQNTQEAAQGFGSSTSEFDSLRAAVERATTITSQPAKAPVAPSALSPAVMYSNPQAGSHSELRPGLQPGVQIDPQRPEPMLYKSGSAPRKLGDNVKAVIFKKISVLDELS